MQLQGQKEDAKPINKIEQCTVIKFQICQIYGPPTLICEEIPIMVSVLIGGNDVEEMMSST